MPILRLIHTKQKKKISLATLLTGLVSISVLLTLTILLISSYHSKKKSLYDTTFSLNLSTASNMSQTMDSVFKSMHGSLKNAAAFYLNNSGMNATDSDNYLELIRNSSNYVNSIVVVDETGLIRTVSPSSIGTAGGRIKTEAAKEALASRKPYISKPYLSTRTKRLIVFISEPIFDNAGVYRGFIGGSIYLQENNVLNMIFGNESPGGDSGSYFYVVGSDGHVLYDPEKSRIGKDFSSDPIVQKLIQGKSGYEQTVNSKGVTLLAGYSYVPDNRWGIDAGNDLACAPISQAFRNPCQHCKQNREGRSNSSGYEASLEQRSRLVNPNGDPCFKRD